MIKLAIIFIGLLGSGSVCQAELNDTPGDFVYDTVQKITWLQDANVFKTLCNIKNTIATEFVPVSDSTAATICFQNGRMSWNDATAWVARLNEQNYLGFNNWRLPLVKGIPDVSCENDFFGLGVPVFIPEGHGYNCLGSELGHLYNADIPDGLENADALDGSGCLDSDEICFQNHGAFVNAQTTEYWFASNDFDDPTRAMVFRTGSGLQTSLTKTNNNPYVWPVRESTESEDSIKFALGWPKNNDDVIGLGMIQGYAIAPAGVDKVELYVDNQYFSDMPYGGIRADIDLLFPTYPNSLTSGFALRYGFRNLSAGPHQLKLIAYDQLQNTNEHTLTVNVQKYGNNWAWDNNVDLAAASCDISVNAVSLDNISVNGADYDAVLSWNTTLQSFSVKEVSSGD